MVAFSKGRFTDTNSTISCHLRIYQAIRANSWEAVCQASGRRVWLEALNRSFLVVNSKIAIWESTLLSNHHLPIQPYDSLMFSNSVIFVMPYKLVFSSPYSSWRSSYLWCLPYSHPNPTNPLGFVQVPLSSGRLLLTLQLNPDNSTPNTMPENYFSVSFKFWSLNSIYLSHNTDHCLLFSLIFYIFTILYLRALGFLRATIKVLLIHLVSQLAFSKCYTWWALCQVPGIQ